MDLEKLTWALRLDSFGKSYNLMNMERKNAADAIDNLLSRAESAEARCETLEKMVKEYQETIIPGYRERAEVSEKKLEAAVFDLLRAEAAAEEAGQILDDEVHPTCDYSLYLALHDSVSDIVNWEKDSVWREGKEE